MVAFVDGARSTKASLSGAQQWMHPSQRKFSGLNNRILNSSLAFKCPSVRLSSCCGCRILHRGPHAKHLRLLQRSTTVHDLSKHVLAHTEEPKRHLQWRSIKLLGDSARDQGCQSASLLMRACTMQAAQPAFRKAECRRLSMIVCKTIRLSRFDLVDLRQIF